jgi:hypothetical protein
MIDKRFLEFPKTLLWFSLRSHEKALHSTEPHLKHELTFLISFIIAAYLKLHESKQTEELRELLLTNIF